MTVEGLPRYSGLHRTIEIHFVDFNNFIHFLEVHADASLNVHRLAGGHYQLANFIQC